MKLDFNSDEIEQLRGSFLQLIPATDTLAESFYAQMFRDHPEVRPYFKTDAQSQQDKLIETLATLLDLLNDSAVAEQALRDLGRRHVAYGATPDLYGWVETTILQKLMEQAPGPEREALSGLWHRLMHAVTDTMLEGANPVSHSSAVADVK